jgi:UDP-2,3-diacylglucosamine pyrophosphatase LpxH
MLDLWRADPVDSMSLCWPYLERMRNMNVETHYVIGNHDYHNWISCLALKKTERFLWMTVHYPYYVFDNTLVLHGDYFDIYKIRQVVPKEAVYAIYAIVSESGILIMTPLQKTVMVHQKCLSAFDIFHNLNELVA